MKKINKDLLRSITVLYVEDEEMIKEEVSFFCERFISDFHVATNGIEGIELYEKVKPDIIITDIQMPKMNGIEMLKKLDTNVPVIITTAFSDIEFFLKAIELNVNKFVIKPVDLRELLLDIQDCIVNRRLKDKLFEKDNLLKIIDENVLISITDKDGIIIDASSSFCDLVGYTKEELIGKTHRIVKHEDTPDSVYVKMWETISLGKTYKAELKNKKKDGSIYWSHLTITPVLNENGKIENYTAIRQDITNKKRLEQLAIIDEVTNLYNRRYFNVTIENEIRRVSREGGTLSLVILDIDFFKNYNDTYGHPSGDKALLRISNVLKNKASRASDFAFRMGGEEFSLIFSGTSIDESLSYVKSILKEIENLQIVHESSVCKNIVTVSAGLIVLPSSEIKNPKQLYKLADEALYEAKNKGRNQVVLSKESKKG